MSKDHSRQGQKKMKTALLLAGLVALAWGGAVPLIDVDADFVVRQKKVISLLERVEENDNSADCHKAGLHYDIEANIDKYTNKKEIEEFLTLYRTGFLPKYHQFSIFYERMRDEAIALFHVMYYAEDFETFYNTAAWAKVYLNEGQFLYAYYIAVLQRPDTQGIVLPAPYELYPRYFFNMDVYQKYGKNIHNSEKWAPEYGVVKENNNIVFYANYSSSLTYSTVDQRLSYFTEDIGLNSYYYYFHTHLPFWWNSEKLGQFKERRGEIYFYFYQQLLARYSLERVANRICDTFKFSWTQPFKNGYYPQLSTGILPFAQRSSDYVIHSEKNYEAIRFLDAYEKTFFQYLQQGHFKTFDKKVDFTSPKSINFVGNYWQTNADLFSEEHIEKYQHSYEITARHVLSGSPKPRDKYTFWPSALDFYQTSLRDPAFYQLYQRIIDYIIHAKTYLHPYSYDDLHFSGVKITDVKVDKLITYFDYFDFNVTNRLAFTAQELEKYQNSYVIRQPRLNHEPFSVNIELKSDVASDAMFKIFIGPKYNSNGNPVRVEEDWMKFYELDWFVRKLSIGVNKVQRKCSEFVLFKEDSTPISEVYKYLEEGKVPRDMSVLPDNMPRRLMLPRGTHGGYPFQLFVFVYPYKGDTEEEDVFRNYMKDDKPFGYPFDRPVNYAYFKQPNMYFKGVEIYHKGVVFSYHLNTPLYYIHNKS